MRLALAHLLALVAFVVVLFYCVAFIVGYAGTSLLNFRISSDAFPWALIIMMFSGPFALILMLGYFALFRARTFAIAILLVSSISLGLAFSNYFGFIELLDSLEQGDRPFVKGVATLLKHWMGKGGWHQGIGGVWAAVTAALAHHLVYAALKPRVIKESVSHA
jgi:hypothetical protein